MKKHPHTAQLTATIAAALLASNLAFGQAARSSQAATQEETEETIVLSPFEVTSADDTGYRATDTLAGTRIRTDLRDVGGAISVITKEFLADIGATDSSTLMQYTPNAEVAGTRGIYGGMGNGTDLDATDSLRAPGGAQRVRGLAAADNTRDFFVTDIPWDSFNVDRIDIQRGPNSILFGLGSPAGIYNAQTRNAGFRTSGEVQARIGSYGSARASVDYNQVLIDDVLAFRVAGLWDNEKFRQKPAFEDDTRIYGTVRFDPQLFDQSRGFRTSIKVKFEHGEIDANRPRPNPPNDSITAWFRPKPADGRLSQGQWTLNSGMGRTVVNNGYDANRGVLTEIVAGGTRGLQPRNNENPNYQPWLGTAGINQQHPFWLLDGTSGQTYQIMAGYNNPGARTATGTLRGIADGVLGKRYADQFFSLQSMSVYANNANLPLAGSGQYRTTSLQDSTVFDFYNTLIDGDTKSEFEDWDAYNIDLSQTAFEDRVGFQYVYDRQKYKRGGESLLGGSPTITMDILQNFADYYVGYGGETPAADAALNNPLRNANGTALVTNPNFGRPYVLSNAGGSGSSYESDREYHRGSLFYELRATDISDSDFLVKLLGRQRFNAVFSREDFFVEQRGWNRVANSREWAGFWTASNGGSSSITERPPVGVIYLGSPVHNRSSATGADIPGIEANVDLGDGNAHVFDPTWQNFGVAFGDPWNVPSNLQRVYGGIPVPGSTTQLTQASNPANYVGWRPFSMNLLRYDEGADNSLLTRAEKLFRQTESLALSWQGYLWNEAIIPTIGWRKDEVTDWDVTSSPVTSNRNIRNLQPDVYRFSDNPVREVSDESTTYGGVVHLNRLFGDRDPLPLNVSLTYSKSSNFQVTSARRDVYGGLIDNPSGETKDYGVVLSTKDNKYSFRAIKYKTNITNGSSQLSNEAGIGGAIGAGLRWRNVFLYDLSGYLWSERERPGGRNSWGPGIDRNGNTIGADQSLTPQEGRAREDAAIRAWNDIQAFLEPRGFFQAWGFTPVTASALTDRSTYEATLPRDPNNPALVAESATPAAQYVPDPATVQNYSLSTPQGFTVAADLESEGYEFELTANPLPNWRIAFNASQTTATRRNVGGPALEELVAFLDSKLFNADGSVSWAGQMPQFGNTGLSVFNNNYGPWRANYVQMKLQEGSDAPEIRKWRYTAVTNYSFREGFLKDVGVGASYRWVDKVVIGYPTVAQGNGFAFDLDSPVYGPSEDALDLWISYERRLTERINWRIQLNGRNMFYDTGRIPISVQPDGVTWAGTRIKPTQEWFLTNTFTF